MSIGQRKRPLAHPLASTLQTLPRLRSSQKESQTHRDSCPDHCEQVRRLQRFTERPEEARVPGTAIHRAPQWGHAVDRGRPGEGGNQQSPDAVNAAPIQHPGKQQ